jgi:hypothetical protein
VLSVLLEAEPSFCFAAQGRYEPKVCGPGKVCATPLTEEPCPAGYAHSHALVAAKLKLACGRPSHFCPRGTYEPKKCDALSFCPEGAFKRFYFGCVIFVLLANGVLGAIFTSLIPSVYDCCVCGVKLHSRWWYW